MPSTPPRYDSLDAWRGVACLLVIVYHSTLFAATPADWDRVVRTGGSVAEIALMACTQGKVGVPIFFVISGYCIAASAESVRRGTHTSGAFFLRRFRRIYPPYWILLLATIYIVTLLPSSLLPGETLGEPDLLPRPGKLEPANWVGAATLTEEWRPLLGGPEKLHFLNHAWTLCYEEQFYAVVGLILVFARRRFYPAVAFVTLVTYLNVTDLNALVGSKIGVDLNRFQLLLPGTFLAGLWLAFAAGVGVYYAVTRNDPRVNRFLTILLLGGTAWAAQPIEGLLQYDTTLSKCLVVAFPFALLLVALHPFDAVLATARFLAPLRFCGRMCYSLYLVHAPICVVLAWSLYRAGLTSATTTLLVTLPACLVISIGCGYAFHRLVERHFLNGNRRGMEKTGN
jgi:peptidoglycan/LPS O-acetylase OafA/YrhL